MNKQHESKIKKSSLYLVVGFIAMPLFAMEKNQNGLNASATLDNEQDVMRISCSASQASTKVLKNVLTYFPYGAALSNFRESKNNELILPSAAYEQSTLDLFAGMLNMLYLRSNLMNPNTPAMPFEIINDDNNEEIIVQLVDFFTPLLNESVNLIEVLSLAHQWGLKTIMHAVMRIMLSDGDKKQLAAELPFEYYPELSKNHKHVYGMMGLLSEKFRLTPDLSVQDLSSCLAVFADEIIYAIKKSVVKDLLSAMLSAPFSEALLMDVKSRLLDRMFILKTDPLFEGEALSPEDIFTIGHHSVGVLMETTLHLYSKKMGFSLGRWRDKMNHMLFKKGDALLRALVSRYRSKDLLYVLAKSTILEVKRNRETWVGILGERVHQAAEQLRLSQPQAAFFSSWQPVVNFVRQIDTDTDIVAVYPIINGQTQKFVIRYKNGLVNAALSLGNDEDVRNRETCICTLNSSQALMAVDSQCLLIADYNNEQRQYSLKILNSSDFKLIREILLPKEIQSMYKIKHLHEARVALMCPGVIYIYDADALQATLSLPEREVTDVTALNDEYILVGYARSEKHEGSLVVWDLVNQSFVRVVERLDGIAPLLITPYSIERVFGSEFEIIYADGHVEMIKKEQLLNGNPQDQLAGILEAYGLGEHKS
jgi:hypothetical protein